MPVALTTVKFCPGCESPSSIHLFEMPMVDSACSVLRCTHCRLIYKDRIPADQGMDGIYHSDYVHFRNDQATLDPRAVHSGRDKLARCERLVGTPRRPRRVLDFGCGRGDFVRIARDAGYDAEGIDPFLPSALESKVLRRAGPESLPTAAFDIVVMLNVAEHLPHPREAFAQVRRSLAPSGVLLLTCPFGDSIARRLYRDRWSHMAHDEHILFWSPESLMSALRACGFDGRAEHRVLGAPFPYGRVPRRPTAPAQSEPTPDAALTPPAVRPKDLQSQVWALARTIQKAPALTSGIRTAIDVLHVGDYLELCIAVS